MKYIIHVLLDKALFHGLIQAADRGVRVRALLDDFSVDEEIEKILTCTS